ncbi:MAG: radical SAM protein [Vicinamibacteria bacterium]
MDDPEALRFAFPDGRPATLLLGQASTVLSVGDTVVSSWDLAGRPYALVRESGTYRRGLDGGLLHKREAGSEGPRLRRRLSALEGETIVEAARREAEAVLEHRPSLVGDRLRQVVAMDAGTLRADAARFLSVCGPVGLLPPDRYLSLVVRVTEGCSWNACTFCQLYRDVPFRSKAPDALRSHVDALREFFGASIALRSSVFLGDANALCLPHGRLLPLLETVTAAFPGAPLYSFVDAWTGERKTVAEWRDCARLGLRRVYVGLETGDPGLLEWLGKPGGPEDAIALVRAVHQAGIAAGVIVLLGAGGERFAAAHAESTAAALIAMRLGPGDFVYFSEYVDDPRLEYGRRAAGMPDLEPLTSGRCAELREAILVFLGRDGAACLPHVATYDIREFVY